MTEQARPAKETVSFEVTIRVEELPAYYFSLNAQQSTIINAMLWLQEEMQDRGAEDVKFSDPVHIMEDGNRITLYGANTLCDELSIIDDSEEAN